MSITGSSQLRAKVRMTKEPTHQAFAVEPADRFSARRNLPELFQIKSRWISREEMFSFVLWSLNRWASEVDAGNARARASHFKTNANYAISCLPGTRCRVHNFSGARFSSSVGFKSWIFDPSWVKISCGYLPYNLGKIPNKLCSLYANSS